MEENNDLSDRIGKFMIMYFDFFVISTLFFVTASLFGYAGLSNGLEGLSDIDSKIYIAEHITSKWWFYAWIILSLPGMFTLSYMILFGSIHVVFCAAPSLFKITKTFFSDLYNVILKGK